MNQGLKWLQEAAGTRWSRLSEAIASQLPVPDGFVVLRQTPERVIRDAYEDIKIREKTHFVAVRGPSHAVLNIVTPDQVILNVRRFWAEDPSAELLVQRMIHSSWCGKVQRNDEVCKVTANEGMMVFDPDLYIFAIRDGACIRKEVQQRQRKMIRHVDGSSKTVDVKQERKGLSEEQLRTVLNLADRAGSEIGWALDDQDREWLISLR